MHFVFHKMHCCNVRSTAGPMHRFDPSWGHFSITVTSYESVHKSSKETAFRMPPAPMNARKTPFPDLVILRRSPLDRHPQLQNQLLHRSPHRETTLAAPKRRSDPGIRTSARMPRTWTPSSSSCSGPSSPPQKYVPFWRVTGERMQGILSP